MKKIVTTFSVITMAGIVFFLISLTPISSSLENKDFTINQGEGLFTIATRLEKNNFIRNRYLFTFYSYLLGLNTKLQAGTFKLSPSLSTQDIITKLSKGGSHDYWLKIIDGSRLEELPIVFPGSQEGYLFPDSYLIPKDFTTEQVLNIISKNFDKSFNLAKQNRLNQQLNDRQAVILASLLEREARTLESKQIVAGILQNRLNLGIALQVDATIQYARDSKIRPQKGYWQPINKKDLSLISPFNTYKNIGLPPSPICNPGFNSLFAVFHPIKTNYLFYITGIDGQMYYARTLQEHNQNIAKYLK